MIIKKDNVCFLCFVLLFALSLGCSFSPNLIITPTIKQPIVATQSKTVQPTVTPQPSSTPLPTFTPNLSPTQVPTVSLSAEGPWLIYLRSQKYVGAHLDNSSIVAFSSKKSWFTSRSAINTHAVLFPYEEEFALLNQNGSGKTLITLPDCAENDNVDAFLIDGENSTNYMASFSEGYYIFRPSQAEGMLVYRDWGFSTCNTFFTGDEKGGLLASIYHPNKDANPELMFYELPRGKIKDHFPLIKCSTQAKDCGGDHSYWSLVDEQEPQWSPNGRYLAFSAIWDATSSDLYIYDKQDGSLRQLTNGPDWVGQLWWSPDGSQIIMEEIPHDRYTSSSPADPSIWSVSVSNNEIKQLYSLGSYPHHLLFWLDDERYVAYDGDSFYNYSFAGVGWNLRMVDTRFGETRILFGGSFMAYVFDEIHETFAIPAVDSPEYQGIYLVSTKTSTIHKIDPAIFFGQYDWNEKIGLFVTDQDCENDPQSFRAFNYQGSFTCVLKPTPTPQSTEPVRYPAPDGKVTISVKDGIWLENAGQTPVQISPDKAIDVIWCPDPSCVFYSVRQKSGYNLYYVSLPDLKIQLVDEGIQTRMYQWLGGKK